MDSYSMQEEYIYAKATERHISHEVIYNYFDKKLDEVTSNFPERSANWRLGNAQYLVWEHFFTGEPFPGSMQSTLATMKRERGIEEKDTQAPRGEDILETEMSDGEVTAQESENEVITVGYISQEEVMKKKQTAAGINKRTYVNAMERFQKEVQLRYSERDYLKDWRKWKEQSLLWDHFFSPDPFPVREPPMRPESWSRTSISKQETVAPPQPNMPQSLISAAQTSNIIGTLHRRALKPLPNGFKLQMERSASSTVSPSVADDPYTSQAKMITSKATELGLQMTNFQPIFKEKMMIAQNRFPGESFDWQTWFAESLVWSSYFKGSKFPGAEPPRLYPLRSSKSSELNHQRSMDDTRTERCKTPLTNADTASRKVSTGTNSALMVDSYRPSDSGRSTVDSYRPIDRSTERRSISNSPMNHAHKANGSRVTHHPKSISAAPSNLPTSLVIPSGLPLVPYIMENIMEKKAIRLGLRREFFRFLQKKRDEVRAEHGSCSSLYRHWAADRSTWRHFFHNEPYPGIEPQGTDLHSKQCVRRQQQVAPSKERQSTSQTQTLAQTQPLPSTQQQQQPPNRLVKIVVEERLKNKEGLCNKILLIDEHVISTTPNDVRRMFNLFSDIASSSKAVVENELRCSLRSCLLETGDAILWSEPIAPSQAAARERGTRFLKGWADWTLPVVSATLSNYWNIFSNSEILESSSSSQPEPSLVLVNGKYIQCSALKLQGLRRLFYQDESGLKKVEDSLGCRFACLLKAGEPPNLNIVQFRASVCKTSDLTNPTKAEVAVIEGNNILEAWVNRALAIDGMESLTLSRYLEEFRTADSEFSCKILIPAHPKAWIRCSRSALKNLTYSHAIDNERKIVEEALRSRIQFEHQETGRVIILRVVPFDEHGITVDRAVKFLWSWSHRAMQDETIKLSEHWKQHSNSHGIATEPMRQPATYRELQPKIPVIMGSASVQPHHQIPLEDSNPQPGLASPDSQIESVQDLTDRWEKYTATFHPTEVDRLLIEEAAKLEGPLRMVFDEDSGLVISLEDFGRKLREQILAGEAKTANLTVFDRESPLDNLTHTAEKNGKRKGHDDENVGRAEKRVRA